MNKNLKFELLDILNDIQKLIEKYYLQAILFASLSAVLYVLFKFSLDIIESFYEMSMESQTFKILGSSIAFLLIITSGAFTFYAAFYLIQAVEKAFYYLYRRLIS